MPGWRNPERLFIGMGIAFDAATWGFYLAAIVWWTVDLGYGPLQLVLLGSVLEVTYLVAEVPTGVLADRFSRKWSVVVAYALMAVSMFGVAATTNYFVMLVSQALFGVGWTFRSGADVAWFTDERATLHRDHQAAPGELVDESQVLLRRHRLGMTAGLLTLIPVLVWGDRSLRGVIMLSGVVLSVTTIWLAIAMTDHFRVRRHDDKGTQGVAAIARDGMRVARTTPFVRRLILIMVLLGLGAEALDRLGFKQFLDDGDFGDESLRATGLLFAALAVLGLAVVAGVERARARGVALTVLAMSLLGIAALGAGVAALAPTLGIALGLALQDPCREALDPVLTALANEHASEANRATVLSIVTLGHGLGASVGGVALALVAELTQVRVAIGIAGLLWFGAAFAARAGLSVGQSNAASSPSSSQQAAGVCQDHQS